jgi:hypothetical protein
MSARTPATSASVVGRWATPAGGHPEERAAAAVVGPTASNAGRTPGGQARASRSATLGLATTTIYARWAARRASASPASTDR